MWDILSIGFAATLSGISLYYCKRGKDSVSGTTLVHPFVWMTIALNLWSLVLVLRTDFANLPAGWSSRLGYFAFTVLLTPFVSVLGAKRPGSRAWDWFVVLPMLLVLNWPALASSWNFLAKSALDLEGPAVMGVIVVLVMILGNYFGTIFTPLVLLLGSALFLGLTEHSKSLPQFAFTGNGRFVISAALLSSLLMVPLISRKHQSDRAGYQRVWLDFRDWFGILWTRRLMDRLNHTARQKKWPVQFGLDGIDWKEATEQGSPYLEEIDHAIRWLFRRFTDDRWIEYRLQDHPPNDSD